jgi:hypothetical protein
MMAFMFYRGFALLMKNINTVRDVGGLPYKSTRLCTAVVIWMMLGAIVFEWLKPNSGYAALCTLCVGVFSIVTKIKILQDNRRAVMFRRLISSPTPRSRKGSVSSDPATPSNSDEECATESGRVPMLAGDHSGPWQFGTEEDVSASASTQLSDDECLPAGSGRSEGLELTSTADKSEASEARLTEANGDAPLPQNEVAEATSISPGTRRSLDLELSEAEEPKDVNETPTEATPGPGQV